MNIELKKKMRLTYIILFILAFASISCSEKVVVLSENELPEDIFYLQDEIKPFTGKCYIYFHNSEIIKEEMNFEDGILHGQRISYFKGGQIKRIGTYSTGDYHGIWKGYDEKGNQLFEIEYQNDSLHGKFISWFPTGVIKETGTFHKNSKVGNWTYYDQAGMILKKNTL